mmetsp:Transcript_41020/g.80722  ORF Transcript_41020/g.80722 Transcript_41020/m.80722 type:complete len:172 (+) Transcript_41020:157-672(+)
MKLLIVVVAFNFLFRGALTSDCDICLSVVDDLVNLALVDVKNLPKDARELAAIEAIESYCTGTQQNLETSQRKMCYYLEPLRQTAARALLMKMTPIRVCRKLSKENPDICNLVTVVKTEARQRREMTDTFESAEDEILKELLSHDEKWFNSLDDSQFDAVLREFRRGVIYV